MKDKKRVLTILLILIIVLAIILSIVLILGGKKAKEYDKFKFKLEQATCEMATKENYTETLCEAYASLCKVRYETLIRYEAIDGNLTNPITHEKVNENTSNYVEVIWKDGKMTCTHKEG